MTNPTPPTPDGAAAPAPDLDRLLKLLDSLTESVHGEDCKAYGQEPDADAEDRSVEISDNPSDFLEHCDCGLKDAFDARSIAKALAATLSQAAPSPAQVDGNTSDGYHTFNELYEHRHALFAVACHFLGGWKSKLHDDGTMFPGWFLAGLLTKDGMISYHLPDRLWGRFPGQELSKAPAWDGHTAADVIGRLWAHLAAPAPGGVLDMKARDFLYELTATLRGWAEDDEFAMSRTGDLLRKVGAYLTETAPATLAALRAASPGAAPARPMKLEAQIMRYDGTDAGEVHIRSGRKDIGWMDGTLNEVEEIAYRINAFETKGGDNAG